MPTIGEEEITDTGASDISETTLLNDALGQAGVASISGIGDGSTNANHCRTFYPSLRDAILRSHHWNCAITRTSLTALSAAPAYEFAYQYQLPPDCLKPIEYAGGSPTSGVAVLSMTRVQVRYRIEGRRLLTNDAQVSIRYIRRITNAGEFDALLYQLIAGWLAAKLISAIHKDGKRALAKMQEVMEILYPLALAVDGQEESPEPFTVDDLTWGRNHA